MSRKQIDVYDFECMQGETCKHRETCIYFNSRHGDVYPRVETVIKNSQLRLYCKDYEEEVEE